MIDEGKQTGGEAWSDDIGDEAKGQTPDNEPYFPDLKLGEAWGESITKQRTVGE